MKNPRVFLSTSLLALATLLLAACEGPDRKAMMDEVRYSVPPMAADEKFFDGEVILHLTLGSNVAGASLFGGHGGGGNNKMTSFKGNAGEQNFGSAAMGGGTGEDIGTGSGASESKLHSAHSGAYQGNEGMSRIPDAEDDESPAARRAREAEMPPALLRLRLENTGGATVVVQIRDVTSELGDFAVRPDTVTIEPGQTVEVEPMQSLLGLQSYALPVTIVLRAGGKTESKVLTLRPVEPAPGTPPPAAK